MSNQTTNEPGDLRVWWVPQIPGPSFKVDVATAAEGLKIIDVLADYDLFQLQHMIKPDYCNAGGLMRYEEDGEGGFGWFELGVDDLE